MRHKSPDHHPSSRYSLPCATLPDNLTMYRGIASVPNGWILIKKYRVVVWLTPLISDSNEQLTGLDTLYFLTDIHPLGTLPGTPTSGIGAVPM
jgi:hypothetical protein